MKRLWLAWPWVPVVPEFMWPSFARFRQRPYDQEHDE